MESDLISRIDERQRQMSEDIKGILTQTTLTNGRVTKLEAWKNWVMGIFSAVGGVVIIVEIVIQIIK